MSSVEIAQTRYRNGKMAFESGNYRQAIEQLEQAIALIPGNSRLGGEVQIWLVTAYEAAGRTREAIALCEQLKSHPFHETSKEARRLDYILKAPRLQRPKEWMSEIPDLNAVGDNKSKMRASAPQSLDPKPREPEYIDLSQINTNDNRFVWVTLMAIALTLGSLIYFSI